MAFLNQHSNEAASQDGEGKAVYGASAQQRLKKVDFSQVPCDDLASLEELSLRLEDVVLGRVLAIFRQPSKNLTGCSMSGFHTARGVSTAPCVAGLRDREPLAARASKLKFRLGLPKAARKVLETLPKRAWIGLRPQRPDGRGRIRTPCSNPQPHPGNPRPRWSTSSSPRRFWSTTTSSG